MHPQRFLMALPYAIILAIAAWFYHLAGHIQYTARGDNLGPDFWPKVALAAMMIICLVQGARLVLFPAASTSSEAGDGGEGDEPPAQRSLTLLAAGLALTIAYGALVVTLGFLLTTIIFTVLFIYAGQYRSHAAIWISAFVGTIVLMLLFQKLVYVSLPRGVPPFDRLTDMLLSLI
ncbi:MAG: tripartite tricarboxylate transporter TctB family protein [Rhodomicrobium sp.]|nr:tripartite tricarboxylate transporter TctB family protein [Rhodomicrobium sp.]